MGHMHSGFAGGAQQHMYITAANTEPSSQFPTYSPCISQQHNIKIPGFSVCMYLGRYIESTQVPMYCVDSLVHDDLPLHRLAATRLPRYLCTYLGT